MPSIVGVFKMFLFSSIRVEVGKALGLVWALISRKGFVWLLGQDWFLVLLVRKVGFNMLLE